jgi:hypothetical protein
MAAFRLTSGGQPGMRAYPAARRSSSAKLLISLIFQHYFARKTRFDG